MQVPNVTLEDLQAFQSKHFPGQTEPPAQDNEPVTDEDLGYYPDGVKRTLTDEQIEMFRHSEIHSLIRKKQLQEDEANYEARMQLPAPGASKVNKDTMQEQYSADAETNPKGDNQAQTTHRGEGEHHDARIQSSVPLDYGDEPSHPQPSTEIPPMSRAPYQGRRIISYDD